MDANGTRFWMLSGREDFTALDTPARVVWDEGHAVLRLRSQGPLPSVAEDWALSNTLRETPPPAVDAFGLQAEIRAADGTQVVEAFGEGLPPEQIYRRSESGGVLSDVAIGEDGVVTVVDGGRVFIRDSRTLEAYVAAEEGLAVDREPWRELDVPALLGDPSAAFSAWRVAPRPERGAWLLDREGGQLAYWTGFLPRHRPPVDPAPGTFRPSPETPETIGLRLVHTGGFDGDVAGGIACAPKGRVAVLGLRESAEGAEEVRVHLFDAEGALDRVVVLAGVHRAYALGWVDDGRLAVLTTTGSGTPEGPSAVAEALVYPMDGDDARVLPVGQRYPLRGHDGGAFVHAPDRVVRYRSASGLRRLIPLSLPRRSESGRAEGQILDSRRAGTCWHRLFLEAVIPEGCGIRVELGASDDGEPAGLPFHTHDFGAVGGGDPGAPRGAWVPAVSEVPAERGVLRCAPEPQRAGLFTALIQRTGKASRRLVGRYLHVRVQLYGSGRATPELAALRAWGPRFSYVREYLPALYHEDPRLEGTATEGPATRADFLERFVAMFEGVFTPLEDRVAEAWRLTNPRIAPAEALDWLGGWVGRTLDPGLDEEAKRRLLAAVPALTRWRGTRHGLELALELVTNGGVSRGEAVVLEEWRLRRTWATILGADLADEEDPLLGGLAVSGNSVVGDTLFLGDEHEREFLALFGEDLLSVAGASSWHDGWRRRIDQRVVEDFFERTAHRAVVLVFDDASEEKLGLLRRVVASEAPAHVEVRVLPASRSFIAGVSALVGVDTRLGVEPPPESVRLGTTRLGAGDRVRRPPSIHPDFEGGGA